MSRRKRHHVKPSEDLQIEWLKNRTGYPSSEERDKIISIRQELSMELLTGMVLEGKTDNKKMQQLIQKYGREEIELAIRKFNETLGQLPSLIGDEAKAYREYRYRYGRFGAGLKFYTNKEIDELHQTYTGPEESDISNGVSELERLLLYGWREWEDITPPAIPPRPDDFTAPTPASFPAPINELLEWGDNLNRSHDFPEESDFLLWKKYIPALTSMALDPGLLKGWPADKASWAPWHAIHALGALEAWESAPALAQLANLENDWLSDHLPHIWAEMGLEVEPSLWMILENPSATNKQRGLAAESLQMVAEDNEALENKIINGFEKILKNTKTFNPTVNAYLIHFLNQMEAAFEIEETIQQAFDEERVDLDIITPEDLEENDWDDDSDDDFDDELDEDEDD
jgi:hypothetical protein